MKRLIFLACIFIYSSSSLAMDKSYTAQFNNCMNSAEGVTVAMRDCYSSEIEIQDKRLNDNYKKFLATLNTDVKGHFVEAQRLWVKFRDENCEAFASQEAGGTLSSVINDSCYLKMTASRADDFQK